MTIIGAVRVGETIWTGQNRPFRVEVSGVAKKNVAHDFVVANEYICTRLAAVAGVPAAQGVIIDTGEPGVPELGFLSLASTSFRPV